MNLRLLLLRLEQGARAGGGRRFVVCTLPRVWKFAPRGLTVSAPRMPRSCPGTARENPSACD